MAPWRRTGRHGGDERVEAPRGVVQVHLEELGKHAWPEALLGAVLGAGGGPLFRFTKPIQADMRWRLSPFRVDVKFEGEALAAYEQNARRNLPAAAESVVLEGQIPNPWPINGWQGHSFIFKFKTHRSVQCMQ